MFDTFTSPLKSVIGQVAMGRGDDAALLGEVGRLIRQGGKVIEIPAWLLEGASPEALKEARALCTLSGVKIVVRA